MQTANKNSNGPIEEPIYVYFDYNGIKVSELFIPTPTKSLSDLIVENSFKYKIPKEVFTDLVLKNRVNLSENNSMDKSLKNPKIQQPLNNNYLEANNEQFNSASTRSNTNKNLKALLNYNFPNSNSNKKKEMIYNEILEFKDHEIPKSKLLELTSNLLENTNKYLQGHKTGVNFLDYNEKENNLANKDNNNVVNHIDDQVNLKNSYNNLINFPADKKNLFEVSILNPTTNSNNNNNNPKLNTNNKNKFTKNNSNSKTNKIASELPRDGLGGIKSPRSIKIDLNMMSGKGIKKSSSQEKSNQPKINLNKKEPKSPTYNFLNTNNLLIKNYKRVNTYAEKEAFAKQIKGNLNQDRLSNIKDNKTYQVYNYKKILPENIQQNTMEDEAIAKLKNSETNPLANNVLIDLDSKGENEIDDVLIENMDVKVNLINHQIEEEENLKAFSGKELIDVNEYADINDIVLPSSENRNGNVPSNKISNSNSKYVSLKNKLDNLGNDYILNLNSKHSNNLLNNKNLIENLLNLNFNRNEANKFNSNNNHTNEILNYINSNAHVKNKSETPEERFIGSENMSEKSSFLFNNYNKPYTNYDITNSNSKNNPYLFNSNINNNIKNESSLNKKFSNNNNKVNLTPNNNLNIDLSVSPSRSNFKSFTRGGTLINKIKKNQLSNSVSKLERSVSHGERLFYKGKLFEEKKSKKNDIYRKMKEAEFEKNCTFKPKINPNSIALSVKANFSKLGVSSPGNAGGLQNNYSTPNLFNKNYNYLNNDNFINENIENYGYNNFENLSNFNSSVGENYIGNNALINNFNLQNIRYKNKQCNHNPMLNNTVNFYENDNSNISRLNMNSNLLNKTCYKSPEEIEIVAKRLHGNAERYRNKKLLLQESYYAQTCPFSPEIISREEGEIPNMDNFFNRLQNWVERRNEKYEIDLEKKQYDERTGNRLFSPQINKSRKHNDFALNESIRERFYELYENHKKKQNKINEIKEQNAQEISFIANITHINEKSKHIVDEIQNKIFIHLFEVLSDKTSNLINGKNVDMSEIPEKIQNILMPLLSELKEQNETLTLDEFIMASKHLYASLPIQFKQNLMEWYLSFNKMKKNMSIQECFNFTFKPKICEKSRVIAHNSKHFSSNLLLKSIDQIKLKHEGQSNSDNAQVLNSNKSLKQQGSNNFNKQSFNPAIRTNMLRNYYEHKERINETLGEENNSEQSI